MPMNTLMKVYLQYNKSYLVFLLIEWLLFICKNIQIARVMLLVSCLLAPPYF